MHTAYAGDRCQRDKLDSSSCLTVSLHSVSQEIVSHMALFVKVWKQRYTPCGKNSPFHNGSNLRGPAIRERALAIPEKYRRAPIGK